MNYLIYFFVFVFGLIIGSFLNCLIWRLHKNETILGRSQCPDCRHKIFWYDNLPLLSFIFLKGRCRHCGKLISWQYPLVELSTAILFTASFCLTFKTFFPGCELLATSLPTGVAGYEIIKLARDWLIICVMTVIFIYDLRWYLILDKVTLPACVIIFGLNVSLGFLAGSGWANLWQLLISGIIGGSFFLIQFLISRGRWIGGGDIRLGLLMGLALGWPNIIAAIFIAYLMGAAIGVILIASGKKEWSSKMPFGTFLSLAAIIIFFWGEQIVNWYLEKFILF